LEEAGWLDDDGCCDGDDDNCDDDIVLLFWRLTTNSFVKHQQTCWTINFIVRNNEVLLT
jgi:hypothetical protein